MPDQPFALFLTWTTYGTWLPGDERGHVSNTIRPDGTFEAKHNQVGTPYRCDDDITRRRAKALQRYPTTWLSPNRALVAAESLVEAASERRWRIVRGAVMANHLHVVLLNIPDDGPAVRRVLKGVSQRRLTERTNGGNSRRWWTAGGSDRYLHGERSIQGAIRYVEHQAGMLAQIIENVASLAAK